MVAPVILFVYSRPFHTKLTVEALALNHGANQHDLIVFSDAAGDTGKSESVDAVREYLQTITGFRSVTVYHRLYNFGLAKSIIEGVTQVLKQYDRIIVLEDDMVTSRYFLTFMNEALDRFANDDRVISIHGYMYQVKTELPEAFFLQGADCWGWATWRRGWTLFNPDGPFLLNELKNRKLIKAFDFNGTFDYSGMLEGQIKGRNDSWAIRWYASAFLAGKLTLYPGRSLVHNIGNDGSGRHCGTNHALDVQLSDRPVMLDDVKVEASPMVQKDLEAYFGSHLTPFKRGQSVLFGHQIQSKFFNALRDWLPPIIIRKIRQLLSRKSEEIFFDGSYSSWEQAEKHSSGYESEQILLKVLASTRKVKNGEAAYERDSVLFDEIEYAWPVTAVLMWIAAQNGGQLSVLDFGGSLGSTYFQNRKFLNTLPDVKWSVVEQINFVEAGRKYITDERLKFYESVEECLKEAQPKVVLFSSVLQYLPEPMVPLMKLVCSPVEIIVIDRTPFLNQQTKATIKVQHVPSAIYSASYPCWFFNFDDFTNQIVLSGFEIIEKFDSLDRLSKDATWQGIIFQRSNRK